MGAKTSKMKSWNKIEKTFESTARFKDYLETEQMFQGKPDEEHEGLVEETAQLQRAPTTSGSHSNFSTPSSFLCGRWLFLSVLRYLDQPKKLEREKREWEFNHFEETCQLDKTKITREAAETADEVKRKCVTFLGEGGEESIPDSIIVLGHGDKKNPGFLKTIEDHISNESIIQHIEQWLDENAQRLNKTNLCLYYCRAAEGATSTRFSKFKVAVYEKIEYTETGEMKYSTRPRSFHRPPKRTGENQALVTLSDKCKRVCSEPRSPKRSKLDTKIDQPTTEVDY